MEDKPKVYKRPPRQGEGRPRKEIDFEELKKLCHIQATQEEICAWFDIDEETLSTRIFENCGKSFSEYFKQNKGFGKVSLRRKQYQEALKGNTALLIWLGKNWLGQADKQEVSTDNDKVIKVSVEEYDD
jgi:hypothetical protein